MMIISIYAPFCAVTALVFSIELFRHYKRQEDYLFTLLCFYALGWYVVNICGLLAKTAELAGFCIQFMLIFVGLITPTLLQFIIRFYKVNIPFRLPQRASILLYIIPAINVIMVLTAGNHTLLTRQLEFISLSPVREMVIVWGPWFWVHTVYSYILSAIIIGLITVQHLRASRFYRLPSTMMALGVSITLIGNLVTLLQIIPPVIEPTLISMSLSLIFFSLAIFNNNNSKFVRFSRAHIYHYLAEYILVLDEKNHVIDFNRAAGAWFGALGISLSATSLEEVMQALLQKGEFLTAEAEMEDQGIDILVRDTMFQVVLNRRVYQMKDAYDESIGKIVVFNDVTENRKLIERLEKKAGVDSLTGLANHMSYAGAKSRLDKEEHLPLSVIMCDANRLKQVNDSLGHEYGNVLLQTIADVLEKVCPEDAFVARIGGDEFVFLLPQTGLAAAEALISRLTAELMAIDVLPFTLSLACGAAVKSRADEDLERVVALADARMYENKQHSRSAQNKAG